MSVSTKHDFLIDPIKRRWEIFVRLAVIDHQQSDLTKIAELIDKIDRAIMGDRVVELKVATKRD